MKKTMPFPLLGVDIGGTKIAVCLGTSEGEILASKRIDNAHRSSDDVLPEVIEAGKELMAETGFASSDLAGVGICAPGPMDIPNGVMLNPPNNDGWDNVPVRDILSDAFGVEAFFENDANAGALAEWMFGAGKGADSMLYLTMSTGIGGGVIANGRLLRGACFQAGEIGHTVIDPEGPLCNCGLKGCYEAFCGGRAVAQRLKKELKNQPESLIVKHAGGNVDNIDYLAFEKAARDGDAYAVKLWGEISRRHAQAMGGLINALNPQVIVMGTIAWAAGDFFTEPIKRSLADFCWKEHLNSCEVTVSALGREIGSYAGICAALNYLYERGEFDLPN